MNAMYPGTFDPLTLGHEEIINRAAKISDNLLVAVAVNSSKTTMFDLQDRLKLVEIITSRYPNVTFGSYEGLTVDFAIKKNAKVMVRGCRDSSDFNFEASLFGMNKIINPQIESIIMISSDSTKSISSSNIRCILDAGGDTSSFLSNEVYNYLNK